jgi:hypothetical protein
MDDDPSAPTQNPALRFRLHAMLGLTTVVALLAAIAGPYYRVQSPDVQSQLAMYWSTLGVCTAGGLWYRWRSMGKAPTTAGEVRFLVWSATKQHRRSWSLFLAVLAIVGWVAFIALQTHNFVRRMERPTIVAFLGTSIGNGIYHGLLTGGWFIFLLRTPTYLCENGVAFGRYFAPWKYIRHAEWLEKAPDVMKFRRLDGDIYIAVSERDGPNVEAFVREKTALLGHSANAKEKPPACAGG